MNQTADELFQLRADASGGTAIGVQEDLHMCTYTCILTNRRFYTFFRKCIPQMLHVWIIYLH